jgi:hypothetical protein
MDGWIIIFTLPAQAGQWAKDASATKDSFIAHLMSKPDLQNSTSTAHSRAAYNVVTKLHTAVYGTYSS